MNTEPTKSANELAAERTDMATDRTVMAAERTLMAWVRTALSMISFGFTIYKLLEAFQKGGGALRSETTPRNVGLFLIALGTASMVLGTMEYFGQLTALRRRADVRVWRPVLFIALILSGLGVFLFVGILIRIV